MTSSTLRRSAFAFALGLTTAGLAGAQPPAAQPPAAGTEPAPAAIRAKQVLGTKVSIQGNISIGTVEDIVFSDAGQVEYLIVNNDNKLVTVPWSAATFNFEKQTAVVNLTPAQFKVIPTFTVTTYPAFFAPTYRADVYKVYGLTPGQLRRLDRRVDRIDRP
ncbi:MAG: PRC-barrel domain-containing protein [Gemmataceae bacterium]|nr:PRC-barrel domain-containing protein [Gemmataceae bacterium]